MEPYVKAIPLGLTVQLHFPRPTRFSLLTDAERADNFNAGSAGFHRKLTAEAAASYDSRRRRRRHEYLDSVVHHSADRMAGWLHRVSRCWRLDSPAAGIRDYFVDLAFCDGATSRLNLIQPAFYHPERLPEITVADFAVCAKEAILIFVKGAS